MSDTNQAPDAPDDAPATPPAEQTPPAAPGGQGAPFSASEGISIGGMSFLPQPSPRSFDRGMNIGGLSFMHLPPRGERPRDRYMPMALRRAREWGKPDGILRGALNYPGVTPGPFMPQASDVRGLLQSVFGGLGKIGSPGIAALAMSGIRLNSKFIKDFLAGREAAMKLTDQMTQRNTDELQKRQQAESEEYGMAFELYDKDPAKLTEAISNIARKHNDNEMLRALEGGGVQAAEKLNAVRDHHLLSLQKYTAQRDKIADAEKKRAGDTGAFNDAQKAAAIAWLDTGLKPASRDRKWNEGVLNALLALGKERGMSAEETMHKVGESTTMLPARQAAQKYWLGGGKGAQGTQRLDVAANHMQALEEVAGNLNNTSSPAWNAVRNFFREQFGYEAPTNFDAVKTLIGGEISSAALGGVGALKDREELRDALNKARSPEQLAGVIQGFKRLLLGQLAARRAQYQRETGRDDFDSMLEGTTLDYLRSGRPPAIGPTPTPPPAAPGAPGAPGAGTGETPVGATKEGRNGIVYRKKSAGPDSDRSTWEQAP